MKTDHRNFSRQASTAGNRPPSKIATTTHLSLLAFSDRMPIYILLIVNLFSLVFIENEILSLNSCNIL